MMHDTSSIKVWDISIRLFHWSLVIFFVIAYITGEVETETLHAWAGYVIIALLVYRLVWGLIGSCYARFSDFIYSPAAIRDYLKSLITLHPKHYPGHNPAGGLMVILLLLGLMATSWSGLKAYEAEGKGPLAVSTISLTIPTAQADDWKHGKYQGRGDDFWEEAHEACVSFMLLLIVLHLGGVAVSSLLHRENLVRAMVTGRKPVHRE
ncbi:MAG: cytochrome b [Zetaproteobacteria bacterium CG12_big_fil_rev_8_21_14_0_65_54_13]|nr:MAG: cytochrome b [Zetaproteobacteria bacterium CG23_combo_of_CG06-09_8_20_14_all_54_7]PIW51062.1 MAG: cytochrome b [Zetaproteobacteria bacterium CG12_big_fil_rev_8_21_14_0_65_54_13]PIX54022.1 MAG: cytochrome b [Zetaproteobacteria bacterium CG_4_10_14_3_um_filter_54_28]PJA28040.1 MAG: cytochrome b [Zetaproteobacteria bacterium CG_4_9_14_3_um_filter_54_145]